MSWAILVASAVVAGLGAVLGGMLTPVAGRWRDGDREIDLSQRGPLVDGTCERVGGSEIYAGYALFGHVWLRRRAFGAEFLKSVGFPAEAVGRANGAVTGRFSFRVRGATLEGVFTGVRFRFSGEPLKLVATVDVAPSERRWTRDGL